MSGLCRGVACLVGAASVRIVCFRQAGFDLRGMPLCLRRADGVRGCRHPWLSMVYSKQFANAKQPLAARKFHTFGVKFHASS